MRYIDDLNEICKMIDDIEENNGEAIVYPVREEGMIFMDYFRYTDKLFRYGAGGIPTFCCIVKESWPENSAFIQRTIQTKPVILLRNLPHFRDTAIFFIAAPNQQVENIAQRLEDFGCKNVLAVTDNVLEKMQNKIAELNQSGFINTWYMNHFSQKITELEFRIEEQLEVRDTNTKAFAEYRNAFRDKKIVIVAGGPTVDYYKPIKDAIHIGINFAWRKENINFDFLFTQDITAQRGADLKDKYSTQEMEKGFTRIKNKIFINKRLGRSPAVEGLVYPNDISLRHNNIVRFFSNNDTMGKYLYSDICYHPTADFCSSVFSALHFSLFTYPREIYLVGCDVTDIGHFYNKSEDSKIATTVIKIGYSRMKALADHYYPETEIISINPVGLKGLFKDVYTDEYKKFLADNAQ